MVSFYSYILLKKKKAISVLIQPNELQRTHSIVCSTKEKTHPIDALLASLDFWYLLINFANSLDWDKA